MIGSFITRGLVMVFGYAYPAYECYKTVELNKPEVEQLRFWCQYWILVAVLTVSERIGDAFISWVPMYSEAKLAFFIYLWYPKTRGTSYVYDSFFRPYVSKHENEIDRNLLELRTKAGDMAVLYWQRAASYGQTRVFGILQYVASQSTPRPERPQTQGARRQPSGVPNRQSSKAQVAQPEDEPPSPTSSTSSSQHQKEVADEVGPSKVPSEVAKPGTSKVPSEVAKPGTSKVPSEVAKPGTSKVPSEVAKPAKPAKPATSSASSNSQKDDTVSASTNRPAESDAEAMQIESVPPTTGIESTNSAPKETLMEESIRLTRGRLRKARSTTR